MRKLNFIHELLTSVWLVSPSTKAGFMPAAVGLLRGDNSLNFADAKSIREEALERTKPVFASYISSQNLFRVNDTSDLRNAPENSHAVITIDGIMTRSGGMCAKGTIDTVAEIKASGENPNIRGVLLSVHSGGGSVYGTEDLADEVAGFQAKYNKPIVGFISGQAASAAYWVVSQTPMIFVSGRSAEAGSIGAITTIVDDRTWLEANGIKEIVVRATQSTDKNEEFYQAMDGNVEPLQKNILDPINKAFIGGVKSGRKGKLNAEYNVFTGKTYFGEEIIKAGLADKMGNQDDALRFLEREARRMQKSNSISANSNDINMFKNLNDTQLATELAKLEGATLLPTSLDFKEQSALLSAAKSEQEIRTLKAELEVAKTVKVATVDATELEVVKADLQKVSAENVVLQEALSASTQGSEDIKSSLEAFKAKEALLESENTTLKVQSKAYQDFISKQFGEETLTAFKMEGNGDIVQPEVKQKTVYLSKEEQKAKDRKFVNDAMKKQLEKAKAEQAKK